VHQQQCQCGQTVFSENTRCINCGRVLGFDPFQGKIFSLDVGPDGRLQAPDGSLWQLCANREQHQICNGLAAGTAQGTLCASCALNRTIPVLGRPENLRRWRKLENAKRRMITGLSRLGLDVRSKINSHSAGMSFDFMEDQRSHPDVLETFVSTGHENGVITINLLEADEVQRVQARELMGERYRTLLGHFRHEAGHFFYNELTPDSAAFTRIFRDPYQDYDSALQTYYQDGPLAEWGQHYISAYACSHPLEDWAECFAHYLHMQDALATGSACGLTTVGESAGFGEQLQAWMGLSMSLNEVSRSLGQRDAYPFIITDDIAQKLAFVDEAIRKAGLAGRSTAG
jgi:hypothetical protein